MGAGCPFIIQRMVNSLDERDEHTQRLGSRQMVVYRDIVTQLQSDLMKKHWLLYVLEAVGVRELTWDNIEFALCEFRKLYVGGPRVPTYRPRA